MYSPEASTLAQNTERQSTNVYTGRSLNIMETTTVVKRSTGSLETYQRGMGKLAVRNTEGQGTHRPMLNTLIKARL